MKTDRQIQLDVQDELTWEPSVNAQHIGVAVNDGIVTMSGTVLNYIEKWAAEQAVGRVSGVKGIAEELEVTLAGLGAHTDQDIAPAAVDALRWNTLVPADKVQVKVEKGAVTLTGDVEWNYQKDAAERAVSGLMGVTRVINLIHIKPQVSPRQVEDSIKKTFARRAGLDADKITMEVKGGEVVLSGHVPTWHEREDASTAAWAAPGVTSVKNHILVYP